MEVEHADIADALTGEPAAVVGWGSTSMSAGVSFPCSVTLGKA